MADYLVAKRYTRSPSMEWLGSRTIGLRYHRYIGLALRLGISIITSIIGFTCLILLICIILGFLLPYIGLFAIYFDQLVFHVQPIFN